MVRAFYCTCSIYSICSLHTCGYFVCTVQYMYSMWLYVCICCMFIYIGTVGRYVMWWMWRSIVYDNTRNSFFPCTIPFFICSLSFLYTLFNSLYRLTLWILQAAFKTLKIALYIILLLLIKLIWLFTKVKSWFTILTLEVEKLL